MERLLSDNWEVKSNRSSEEVLQELRTLCGGLFNRKRRFLFTAHISKRYEAAAMRKTNQENLGIAVLVSKADLHIIQGEQPSDYTVPKNVQEAGFQICADELGSIVEGHDVKKLKFHGGGSGIADEIGTSTTNGLPNDDEALRRREEIYGINEFTEAEAEGFLVFVSEALLDMTLMTIGVCAVTETDFF